MIVQDRTRLTVEDFDRLVELPEHADQLFEYIGGEAFEVPSNPRVSEIAALLSFYIILYLKQNGIEGHVTGEAGGYTVSGERYAPDVTYISAARQPELAERGYNPIAPELAVEVISPSDREDSITVKVANYLAAGVLVWLVRYDVEQVQIYAPGQAVKVLGLTDTLDGGEVLPGLLIPVSEIFKKPHGK